jgi:hypothetical protein
MIFIASSFFAGMPVSTASAQSPCETGNDTKATLEAEGDTVSDVPASHDLNSLKQDILHIWPTTPIPKFHPTRNQRILFSIR